MPHRRAGPIENGSGARALVCDDKLENRITLLRLLLDLHRRSAVARAHDDDERNDRGTHEKLLEGAADWTRDGGRQLYGRQWTKINTGATAPKCK
jgi:hypothetical protein